METQPRGHEAAADPGLLTPYQLTEPSADWPRFYRDAAARGYSVDSFQCRNGTDYSVTVTLRRTADDVALTLDLTKFDQVRTPKALWEEVAARFSPEG